MVRNLVLSIFSTWSPVLCSMEIPEAMGKRFQDDLTEIQVAESCCCWGFILNWWKPSMFFGTGEGQLKKIWHQEYNAVEKQKVIDRKLRNMEHRKVSLFGGGWFFPLGLHRLKGWLSFLLVLKMRQLDQALKLALIFFRGNMAETHLKDLEKHILSFRARVPHFGGTTSQERFTWVDCIYVMYFLRLLSFCSDVEHSGQQFLQQNVYWRGGKIPWTNEGCGA